MARYVQGHTKTQSVHGLPVAAGASSRNLEGCRMCSVVSKGGNDDATATATVTGDFNASVREMGPSIGNWDSRVAALRS